LWGSLVIATVKTALTPVAIVKDVVNVATDQDADATGNLIDSALEDLEDAGDSIGG